MNFLRKIGEEILTQHSLVSMLMEELSGYVPARSHRKVHASALTNPDGFCPREYALLWLTEKELKPRFVGAATQVAFDNGHALEELCRDKWLRTRVVGHWICLRCKTRYEFRKVPVKCAECNQRQFQYDEVVFVDPHSKAQGAIDFFVDFGTGKYVMCEVKSIDKDSFGSLVAPLAEHRVRTQVYLEIIERSAGTQSAIETAYGKVLYISKGFGVKSEQVGRVIPFKEFRVDANAATAVQYLDLAGQVDKFTREGVLPKGICPTPLAKRCKQCAVAEECWSGRYPANTISREWKNARDRIEE